MAKKRKRQRRKSGGQAAIPADMRIRLQWLAVVLVVTGLVIWFAWPKPTVVDVRVPELSNLAEKGQLTFRQNCQACHGENGAGSKEGPPLIHNIYNPGHHADFAFQQAMKRGVSQHHWTFGNMPPQPQVSEQEAATIIRFIRELQRANGIAYRRHRM